MTTHDIVDIVLFILGTVITLIGYLMSRQIDATKKDIDQLYSLHHKDEGELNVLKVKLAENYPMKVELREVSQDIKDYLDEKFKLVEQIIRNNTNGK